MKIKYFSGFSGIGGFDQGITQVFPEVECIGYSEIDKYAVKIYDKHFPDRTNYGNIKKINEKDLPDFDMLCGGFPCQDLSIAGKRAGLCGARSGLFFEIIRIIREKQPLVVFLENVKGLLSSNDGADIETVCEELSSLGYIVKLELYNSKDFGVPQNRERIFLICTNIRKITNIGQNKTMGLSETTIQEWLFQILLNNLEEVLKPQERESKDSVMGWLILNEIANGLKMRFGFSQKTKSYLSKNYPNLFQIEDILQSTLSQDFSEFGNDSKKDTILTVLDAKLSTFDMELVWQNIDTLLKQYWEENYLGLNKYTISTAIKQITEWRTFTYSQMLLSILTLTVQLRSSSNALWNEILSNLIVIQEGMSYARVNKVTEKEVISESYTHHPSSILRDRERVFIIGHLRGQSWKPVFPIRESTKGIDERPEQTTNVRTLMAGGHSGGLHSSMTLLQVAGNNQSNCLSNGGGQGAKTGLYVISDSGVSRKSQLRIENIAPLRANTGAGHNNVVIQSHHPRCGDSAKGGTGELSFSEYTYTPDSRPHIVNQIRRLTPLECERLQGYPDGWTEGISDTQRYKCLGNAVTVNVIAAIVQRMRENISSV